MFGKIFTSAEHPRWAEAACVRDGRFVYVGSREGAQAFVSAQTTVVDVGEHLILPGFIDGHTHAFGGKISELYMAHLLDAESVDEYLSILRDFIGQHPDYDVYLGMGWSNGLFENYTPTAALLDAIEPRKPVIIRSSDWHAYWVNSAALRAAGIDRDTECYPGGKIERDGEGKPTGCLRETAMWLVNPVIPRLSVEQYKTAILAVQDKLLAYGDTAYMDVVLNFDHTLDVYHAYEALARARRLKMHVFGGYMIDACDDPETEIAHACALRDASASPMFHLTDIKVFVDGVVEGGTGFLDEPFASDPAYHGENRWSGARHIQKLEDVVERANRAGFAVHFHTIGDAAITLALDVIEKAQRRTGLTDARNALTHLQMVTPEQIGRMKKLGVLAVVNPYWFFKDAVYFHEVEVHYLGAQRAEREYPHRSFYDLGVQVSMASDYPITAEPNPLEGIQIGATRMNLDGDPETLLNREERVSVEQLIHSATAAAAYQLRAESRLGSIEVGKSADFVELDTDITRCPPENIRHARVLKTFVAGQLAFSR